MAHAIPSNEILLYVWPHQWNLPSFDAPSLSAVLYLQLAIPGKFSIVECTEQSLSPSGQFPFLVHGQAVISSFASIVKYTGALAKTDNKNYPDSNVDAFLSPVARSQRNAWIAHIESNLGDLVYCALFSLQGNWEEVTHPALASLFPVPQRYYVPQKLREAYQPRLDAAGLWSHVASKPSRPKASFEPDIKPKSDLKPDRTAFQKTFEKEKVLAKARLILDIYKRLLGDKDYIYEDQVSTLDVALASRVLLLLEPPCADSILKVLLVDSYPLLCAHARRVRERLLGSNSSPFTLVPHHTSLWPLIPLPKFRSAAPASPTTLTSPEDLHYGRMRWGFLGLSLGSLCAYVALVGFQQGLFDLKIAAQEDQLEAEAYEDETRRI